MDFPTNESTVRIVPRGHDNYKCVGRVGSALNLVEGDTFVIGVAGSFCTALKQNSPNT